MTLSKKIDFLCIIVAEDCNPNGDPLCGNRPRQDFDGFGEMSQECIKRKIRNRLQDMGEHIFVQSDDRCDDGCDSLRSRADSCEALKKLSTGKNANREKYIETACKEWFDVRAFGQIFAFKPLKGSVSVRGPVSVTVAKSIDCILIKDYRIVKSVNTDATEDGRRDSSTMGRRYAIDKGVYIFKGGIHPQLAAKTGFTDEDAEKVKRAILTLFDNDVSNSRPNGTMAVAELYWWENKGQQSICAPIKLLRSVKVTPVNDYPYYKSELEPIEGITPEIYKLL